MDKFKIGDKVTFCVENAWLPGEVVKVQGNGRGEPLGYVVEGERGGHYECATAEVRGTVANTLTVKVKMDMAEIDTFRVKVARRVEALDGLLGSIDPATDRRKGIRRDLGEAREGIQALLADLKGEP